MILTKPYAKYSLADKSKLAKDTIAYAKEAGLPLKKKKRIPKK